MVTAKHEILAATIRLAEPKLPFSLDRLQPGKGTGRKPCPNHPLFRFQLVMPIFRQSTFKDTRKRLFIDNTLKALCGFECIAWESTFSRYLIILSGNFSMANGVLRPMNEIINPKDEGESIIHACRDSTAIPACKTGAKKLPKDKGLSEKRERKTKGSLQVKGYLGRDKRTILEKEVTQPLEEALSRLNAEYGWSGKDNSQAKTSFWRGYKLHLDATATGIPLSYVVAGQMCMTVGLQCPWTKGAALLSPHGQRVLHRGHPGLH